MASFTGKSIKDIYKDILHTDNSNTGISTGTKTITCGDGDTTALQVSNQRAAVYPSSDNTSVFRVRKANGDVLLLVDTTNSLVKAGTGSHILNTQYAHFSASSSDSTWAGGSANTHYAVPFNGTPTGALVSGGTSTDPATSFTVSTTGDDMVGVVWYVMDNITIDRVIWLSGADSSSGDTTRAHLMSYTMDVSNGTTGGDLSSGTVLAYSSSVVNAGYEQGYYNQMTISSADVDAGKAILFFFRGDSVNSDYQINATIKYHLR